MPEVSAHNIDLAMKVFREHGDFIRSVIRFNIRNEALSEDVFQDLFLFLISKPIPEDVRNVRGFLYRVVSDRAKDAIRRVGRYQARIRRYAEHLRYTALEGCPENALIKAEETEKLFESIRKCLPAQEALAVTLRYRNECDVEQLAERMGVESRSVSRYVSVGVKKLRHLLHVTNM